MKRHLTLDTTPSDRETIIARTEVFSGKILRLVVDRVRLPDGAESTRELVQHPGAVAIIPVLPDGKILLVRQYRHAVGKFMWEVPAGKLDVKGESPLNCAKRELREETGYTASDWDELFAFYTSPGFTNERIVLYTAAGLTKVASPLPDEISDQAGFTQEEIIGLISRGEIEDGKTILGVSWLWAKSK